MRFRNSTRLMTENFKNTYKILAYKAIVILVTLALSAALFLPGIVEITQSAQMQKVIQDIKDFFVALVSGNVAFLQGFKESFTGPEGSLRALVALLNDRLPTIIGTLIGLGILYFVGRFVDTLCYFSIGSILNDTMATYADNSFSDAYIKNLGRASLYSIVYVPIVFLCDVLIIGGCYLFFFWTVNLMSVIVSLFLAMTFVVLAQALKLTLTSMWLPAMITDKQPLKKAMRMKNNMTGEQARKIYMTYVVSVYLVVVINAVAGLCTFGSAILITIPASYFFFICMQFVNYYTVKGKKYFITFEEISVNPTWTTEHRQFFETMELEHGVPETVGGEKEEKKADAEAETKTAAEAKPALEAKAAVEVRPALGERPALEEKAAKKEETDKGKNG